MLADVPSLLSYPRVYPFEETPEILGQYVYPIRRYSLDGLAIVVNIEQNAVRAKIGDWDGRARHDGWLFEEQEQTFVQRHLSGISELMQAAAIPRALYYVSCGNDGLRLVDMRVSLDRMAGPGMLKDLFKTIMPVQESISDPVIMDKETIARAEGREGIFRSGAIFKPSAFKTILREGEMQPLYVLLSPQV